MDSKRRDSIQTRREVIEMVTLWVIGLPLILGISLLALIGFHNVFYSISSIRISHGGLLWLVVPILVGGMFVLPAMYWLGEFKGEFDSSVAEAAFIIGVCILSTAIFALAAVGVGVIRQMGPSAPLLGVPITESIPIPVSPVFVAKSVGVGIVCSVLLYGFGRLVTLVTPKIENRHEPSRHLPPESNAAAIDRWVIPATAWGVLVASGTFCGFLVGLYTSNRALQLFLAIVASVAAGAFAIRQLRK